jgi:glycosyltransferase involved in cell wall biosynthesis
MAHIAVDMTPLLPGGENGGVKLLALELIKGFQTLSQDNRFLLLTASWNDKELAFLDSPNTQRLCIVQRPDPKVSRNLPGPIWVERGLRKIYWFVRRHYREKIQWNGPLSAHGIDVLFCPFTALTYAEPGIPVVSVICDLQHMDYPQFFAAQELDTRKSFYTEVSRRADAIICISESTRESVIRLLKTDPEKTYPVHICIQSRLAGRDSSRMSEHLRALHIDERPFMFYPANFWPHKNHRMLLTAYGMYVSRHPDSELDLVFTGALDDAQRDLQEQVKRMGLERYVHFLGYLPEDQLIAVWRGCSFLIFPSLYEGFGIPVLEAMQFGKPVLCSNVTSLPEVAGDAALYFDPRKPAEIVQCLEKIIGNRELAADLVNRGHERLPQFQPQEMVKRYLQCIEEVINSPRRFHDEIKGVYRDGWTGNKLDITHSGGSPKRTLELILEVPKGVPYRQATIRLDKPAGKRLQWTIGRGRRREIRLPLTERGNHLVFSIEPAFIPVECNMGTDARMLGVLCKSCRLVSAGDERTSLWPAIE